jgi:hypothetical protein
VTESTRVAGMIGSAELARAVVHARIATPLRQAMSRAAAVEPTELLAGPVRRAGVALVAAEEGWPVGVVRETTVGRVPTWPAGTRVHDRMDPHFLCLPPGTPAFRAAAHALRHGVRCVVVMGDAGLLGVVTPMDFARLVARQGRARGAEGLEHHAA